MKVGYSLFNYVTLLPKVKKNKKKHNPQWKKNKKLILMTSTSMLETLYDYMEIHNYVIILKWQYVVSGL